MCKKNTPNYRLRVNDEHSSMCMGVSTQIVKYRRCFTLFADSVHERTNKKQVFGASKLDVRLKLPTRNMIIFH